MATEYPVFKVTQDGISAPTFPEVLDFFRSEARRIFGNDTDLDEDTHDGQMIGVFAAALHEVNSQAVEVFNAYNPQTAYGVALDSAVKTNGITRRVATHSTVDLSIVGQAGTVIRGGEAKDTFGNIWLLPDEVLIPVSGEITVTATAKEEGDISAVAFSITEIATPTRGWQSVSNFSPATPGSPVETDSELREKQSLSTMNPSVSLWDGLIDTVSTLPGVIRASGVNNDTSSTNEQGVPAHSCALVVDGGDAMEIAKTIYRVKGQGVGTYGTVSETIVDRFGFENTIHFSRPIEIPVFAKVTIIPNRDYTEDAANAVRDRLIEYINDLGIGKRVDFFKIVATAMQKEGVLDNTYTVTSVLIGKSSLSLTQGSIEIGWNEFAKASAENIQVVGEV